MKIQEVIDCVLTDSTGETRIAPTCDQLMTGDPQQEVKGIAVTFMATVEVIREAAAKGVNLSLIHISVVFFHREAGQHFWGKSAAVILHRHAQAAHAVLFFQC